MRIWDIEKSDNYLLKMDLPSTGEINTHVHIFQFKTIK